MAISMLKIRRPLGRLIFNMGIAILGKTVFLIETAPRFLNMKTNDANAFQFNIEWSSKLYYRIGECMLTRWGRVTHIWVSKLTIIGSDNGLSPGRRRVIFWINAGTLSIEPLGTHLSEIFIEIYILSFKKMHIKCRLAICGHFFSTSMC